MRITYLHQYFNTPQMQGSTRSYEFARRLVARGHTVNLVTAWRTNDGKQGTWVEDIDGIQVHWIASPYDNTMGYARRLMAFLQFAYSAARLARSIPSDVVFATSTPLTIAPPAVHAAKRQDVPMVFEVRDLWPDAPIAIGALRNPVLIWLARRLESYAYRNAKRIVALSPKMKDVVATSGFNRDHISVVPNACDIELFDHDNQKTGWILDRLPQLEGCRIVTYAGTVGKVNGVSYLVDIAVNAREQFPNVRFVVVGAGNELELVRDYARRSGVLDETLFFLPAVSKADMPKVLAGSHATLSLVVDKPELSADSANKFFDSLAAARPICINHGGYLADLLTQHGAGLVLPPADATHAAELIGQWVSDTNQITRAGQDAFALANSHFNRDDLTNRLEEVLVAATDD